MKKTFLLLLVFALCALTSSAQQANIYASGLKAGAAANAQVEISYVLNTDATAVAVNFVNGSQTVATVPVTEAALLTKGAHTATISLATVPAGTYKWSVSATAAANTTPVKVSGSDSKFRFYFPTGLAVDNSFESPAFGRIYVAEGAGSYLEGDGAATYWPDGRISHDGIYIFTPTFDAVNTEAYTGNVAWDVSGLTFSGPGTSPGRLSIDDAGKVYIADNSITNSGIYVIDPAHPENDFSALFAAGAWDATGILSVNETQIHGRIPALYVEGSGANTNLYYLDRNYLPAGQDARAYLPSGMIFKYNNLTAPIASQPALVYDNPTSALANDAMGLVTDGRGGYWVSQNRAADAAAIPSLSHINAAGVADYKSADGENVNLGNSARGALAINAEKNLLAVASDKTVKILSIAYDESTGVPTLTEVSYSASVGTIGTNVDGLAFDVAGNLYAVSASPEYLYVYALPKADNTFTTPAPAAATITVGTVSQTPQANIYASELKAEKVDNTHYTFTYTLNANATSGTLNFTSGGTTTSKPAPNSSLLTKGTHSMTLDLGDLANGDYSWSMTATGAATTAEPVKVSNDDSQLLFYAPRGITVDNSFDSPFFGSVYVAEMNGGPITAGSPSPSRTTQDGIYVLNAALQDVSQQGENAYQGGISWKNPSGTDNSPFRVSTAPDGKVYISDWSDARSGIWIMDPAHTETFVPVFGGTLAASGLASEAGVDIHGSISHCYITGTGADTKLYTVDEDWSDAVATGKSNILQYNIGDGATTLPWISAPSAVVYNNIATGNDGLIVNRTNMIVPGNGGWWLTQACASNGSESRPAIIHIGSNGIRDYNSGSLITSSYGAMAISPDGKLMAVPAYNNGNIEVYDITYPDNTPVLTYKYTVVNGGTSPCVAFDHANNLYAVSHMSERLTVFALPKDDNAFTTPASQKIQVGTTGIKNPEAVGLEGHIRIATGNESIRLLTDGVKVKSYILYSVTGTRILNGTAATGNVEIPISRLNAGVYLIQITTDKGTIVKRFIKK